VNDGPLCRCALDSRETGIRHGIYPGETPPIACQPMKNNIGERSLLWLYVLHLRSFLDITPTL